MGRSKEWINWTEYIYSLLQAILPVFPQPHRTFPPIIGLFKPLVLSPKQLDFQIALRSPSWIVILPELVANTVIWPIGPFLLQHSLFHWACPNPSTFDTVIHWSRVAENYVSLFRPGKQGEIIGLFHYAMDLRLNTSKMSFNYIIPVHLHRLCQRGAGEGRQDEE